ncbi:PilZ domain-containing protein [Sphingopyxis sp.]|uniref:PilZ domain-containing protein n=1 Tax=Sphingopyxis sp. TaxID=1908224 RepID=UPI002FCB18EF
MSNPEVSPASSASSDKRQPRQSRLVKAALACSRLGQFDVTIRNVSETGLGGQAPDALHIGERVTVFLPGHDPMLGTVRWVADKRFGIETDKPVETTRLRAALGGNAPTANDSAGFEIIPPPTAPARRPGLVLGAAKPAHFGRSVWTSKPQ